MAATEVLVGSVIEVGKALVGSAHGDTAVVVPRLVVRGDGSSGMHALNLQLTNIGKVAAFSVQVGVPWHQMKTNGTKVGAATHWWSRHTPWYLKELWFLGVWQILPSATRQRLRRHIKFITRDVGLVLAPGESTEMYFGQAGTSTRGYTMENAGRLMWEMGTTTTLTVSWFNGTKRWPEWLRRKTANHQFAIHSHQGIAVSAHQRWT